MNRKSTILLAVLMLSTATVLPLANANGERAPTAEEAEALQAEILARWAEVRADFDAPSTMTVAEAAAALAARAAGHEVAQADLVEATKLMRDVRHAGAADAGSELGVAFAGEYLATTNFPVARDLVADKDGFDALLADVHSMNVEELRDAVAALGVDAVGAARHADLLAAAFSTDADAVRAWTDDLRTHRDVWYQEGWDYVGLVTTLVYLGAYSTVPEAGSELIPHNIRINAFFLDALLRGGQVGSLTSGYFWAQLDAEILLGLAFDQHLNVDSLLALLGASVRVELHYRISCGWTGCSISTWIVLTTPETLLAREPVLEFAYPATAGHFPTRADSMDLFQSVYDRLGQMSWQVRDATVQSQYPGTPGLGDLSTQAPIVSWFGTQVPPPPVAIPAVPAPPADVPDAPAEAPTVPFEVHQRVRGDFATIPLPVDSAGVTAAFEATQHRAWHLTLLVVRWHNVGVGTTGLVGEAPASIYYDAAWHFTRGSGNVMTSDWSVVEDLGLAGAAPV